MKVICIDNNFSKSDGAKGKAHPMFNEVYTVVDTVVVWFGVYYELAEFDHEDLFKSSKFIPLSNIDETTFVRELKELTENV